MKKFNTIALTLLAGAALVSCEPEQMVQIDPGQTVAPVLNSFEGATLDGDGADLAVTFTPAEFGVTSPVGYTFYAAPSGAEEGDKLAASIANSGSISIKQKDLNSYILNHGGVADDPFAIDFWLTGYLCTDKGAAIPGTEISSNKVTVSFIAYNADINDVDVYEHIWVIGSSKTIGAWEHGDVYQYLYNYSKDGKTFEGLIDYGTEAASGWKLTGIAGWDDSCNWGTPDQAEEAESPSITLITGGGSKDIKCYSKRFYKWSFDNQSLVLNKVYGFDNVGIVGSFNGWDPADDSAKMEYNGAKHRFYIDYIFSEEAKLKFTCDNDWTLNWGEGCVEGGSDIVVAAGSYRIYLDLNRMEYTFSTSMYGKEEPGMAPVTPVEPEDVWSVIGLGNDWNTDYDLSEKEDGVWAIEGLELTEKDEFKFRYNHAWATSVGATTSNATSIIDETNVYEVFKPEIGVAFDVTTDNGKNIAVQVAGSYDIVYDTNNQKVTVSEHASGWSLIGSINDDSEWKVDVDMTETVKGLWVSPVVTINGGFKLRFNKDWGVNRGGTLAELEKPFAVEHNGADISVPVPGEKYVISYFEAAEAILIQNVSNCWSIIGNVDGSEWDKDVFMHKTGETTWAAACRVNGECKIRFGAGWDVNRGGTIESLDTPFDVTDGGGNIKLEDGCYTIVYDSATEKITISQTWGLIGNIFSTGWSTDFLMYKDADGNFVYNNAILETGWKIRFNGGWDVNRGGVFESLGTGFEAVAGGADIASPGAGLYNIVYSPATEQITISAAL